MGGAWDSADRKPRFFLIWVPLSLIYGTRAANYFKKKIVTRDQSATSRKIFALFYKFANNFQF